MTQALAPVRPRIAPLDVRRGYAVSRVCHCGSDDWLACQPGTAAECHEKEFGVLVLRPADEIAATVWCARCWPWTPAVQTAKRRARR